jgi:hypothetical protein
MPGVWRKLDDLLTSNYGSLASCDQHEKLKVLIQRGEDATRQDGALVLRQSSRALDALEQPSSGAAQPEAGDQQSFADLQAEIEQASAIIDDYQQLLTLVMAKVESRRTGLKVKNVKIENKGKGTVGITGADGTEGELNVNIEDVAINDARGMIGYTKGAKLDNFWD